MITKEELKLVIRKCQRKIKAHKLDLRSNNPEIHHNAPAFIAHFECEKQIAELALKQMKEETDRQPVPSYSLVERSLILEHITRIKDPVLCDMMLGLWNWYTEKADELDLGADNNDTDEGGTGGIRLLQSPSAIAPDQV